MSKETALSYRNHMGVMFNLEILFKPPIKFSYKLSIKNKMREVGSDCFTQDLRDA